MSKSSLSPSLHKELITSLSPHMETRDLRKYYLDLSLGFDSPVTKKLNLEVAAQIFANEAIGELLRRGRDDSGEHTLVNFVKAIQEDVGKDIQQVLENLISQIQKELSPFDIRKESHERFLSKSLLRINFRDHERFVKAVLDSHRVVSFLVHGEPFSGQSVLWNRLLKIPKVRNNQVLHKIDLTASGAGTESSKIWIHVNRWLTNLPRNAQPSDSINEICERLKTQNVIFVFDKVDYMSSETLKEWLEIFWVPLLKKAGSICSEVDEGYYLLVFFVDNAGKHKDICFDCVQSLESIRDFSLPLNLPAIKRFSEPLLDTWHSDSCGHLDDDGFRSFEDINIQKVLKNAEGGIPEYVYEEICKMCGYSWVGSVSACLK
jgi:hypothetical protein